MTNIETTILNELFNSEKYARRTITYLKKEFFTTAEGQFLFTICQDYFTKHNSLPNQQVCEIEAQNSTSLSQDVYKGVVKLSDQIFNKRPSSPIDVDWLVYESEKWVRKRALTNAILESARILDPTSGSKRAYGEIENLVKDALATGFDFHQGHDYFDDHDARFNFYHRVEEKIPFDIDNFNYITNGGLSKKTLNIALAGTNCGKSAFMCHVAAAAIQQGKNVLYITCEMAEEKIAERIDANLLDLNPTTIQTLSRKMFHDKIMKLKSKIQGNLKIKEYPTGIANVNDFRALLAEYKSKQNFVPDLIVVDYLNICASVRYNAGSNNNSYTIIKAIAEELRGLAIEQNVPILSATQTNRSSFVDSDFGLEGISESFGTAATADIVFALIRTEQLDKLNQIAIKQLKNRYDDLAKLRRFVIGYERDKFRFYDVNNSGTGTTQQHNAGNSSPPMQQKSAGIGFPGGQLIV